MEEATGAPSSFTVWDPKRLRASGRDGETIMTEPPSPLRMLLSRHTKRREFITLLGGSALSWPFSASGQPADRSARVGFFGGDRSTPFGAAIYQAFLDELQIHGFRNGQNLIVDYRRVEQDLSALSADAAELVRSNVNVLVTQGTEPALQAALGATRTVPIVMMAANYDPFASGYVRS